MKTLIKNNSHILFLLVTLAVTFLSSACSKKSDAATPQEDRNAKNSLQGVWTDDLEGNVVFSVRKDTIYYNDSLSKPAYFYVREDTLYIRYHDVVKYPIKKLTDNTLIFINESGDEIELVKNNNASAPVMASSSAAGFEAPNQGKVIKNDSVMTYGEMRYHAYKKVNPTSLKVYIQTKNDDGLSVENTYYDNIVYIALYTGSKKIFGKNITKKEFKGLVPDSYLEQAILSDVLIDSAGKDGVKFIAVLTIPYSSTTYRINILISPAGKKTLSL